MGLMDQKQAPLVIMISVKPMIYLPIFSLIMALTRMMIFSKDFSQEEKEVIIREAALSEVLVVDLAFLHHHFLIMMIFSKVDLVVLHLHFLVEAD